MAEILGEGFIQILPDVAQFNTLLQAEVTASLSAIEKQFATAKLSLPAAANPLANIEAGAASAAATITQKTAPALQALSGQLKSIAAIRTDVGAATAFNNIGQEANTAANVVGKQFTPALKAAGDEVKTAGKSVEGASTSLGGFQRQLLAVTKLAPLIAAGFSIKVFADFEKAAAEAAVVFGDSANEIISFAEHIDSSFRLSTTNALKFTAEFGNTLTNIGFSTKVAADASEVLTKRVADTAAALKQTPTQIAQAFTLILEGNTRGAKQLDITISALDQANKAAQLGFKGTVAELTDAQRAQVNYQLVLEKTNKFQGDAAATANTLGGQIGAFKTAASDAALSIGRSLAPALENVLAALSPIFDAIKAIPTPVLAFASAAGIAAVAIKALSVSLGLLEGSGFVTFLSEAAAGISLLAGELVTLGEVGTAAGLALDALGGPVALVAVGLGALAAVFSATKPKVADVNDQLNVFKNTLGQTGDALRQTALTDIAKQLAAPDVTNALKAAGISITDFTTGVVGSAEQAQQLRSRLIELHGEGKITDDQFTTLTNTAVNLSGQFGDAQTQSDNLQAAMKALGIVSGDNTASFQAQADAIKDLFSVTDQLSKANDKLTTDLAQQAADQKKLNDLRAEGGKQEKSDAQAKLTEAQNSLTDAIARRTKAQKALDELDAQDFDRKLAEAANNVTEAQISLREAIKARDDAQKALNRTQITDLNLTGLNLTQIRSALANARLSLAASRSTAKTPQQLQDELTTAQIDVFNATNKVSDAQAAQNKLIAEGKTGTDAHIAAVDELNRAIAATTVAQDEVKKRSVALGAILAGNSQFAKDLATAQAAVKSDTKNIADDQATITKLVGQQRVDTSIINGDQAGITASLQAQAQILDNLSVFQNPALRRAVIENFLETQQATQNQPFGPGLTPGPPVPITANSLTPQAIDALFNALKNDPARFRQLLKAFGINIAGFAGGGLITRPQMSWIGENFHAESVIPWTKPDRVWEVLAQSLPHMPATVRERLEPAISPMHRPRLGSGHSTPTSPELDYERLASAIADALKKEGVGASLDITVAPTPGMSEAQLARRVAREWSRYWGNP